MKLLIWRYQWNDLLKYFEYKQQGKDVLAGLIRQSVLEPAGIDVIAIANAITENNLQVEFKKLNHEVR